MQSKKAGKKVEKRLSFIPTRENRKKLEILQDVFSMSLSDAVNTCIDKLEIPSDLRDVADRLEEIRKDYFRGRVRTIESLFDDEPGNIEGLFTVIENGGEE